MRVWEHVRGQKVPVLAERAAPEPGPGEVLVEVEATGLHPVDLETAKGGNAPLLPLTRPFVGGVDWVGRVLGTGAGVDDLAPGARVFGYQGVPVQGAWAERIAARRETLALAPPLELETLACLPLPALCALQALDAVPLAPGATVLVHGGAGGVGGVAVQIFAARGLRVVATASARDLDRVRGLGAAEVVDHQSTRFEAAVSGVDLVFDTVGGDMLQRSVGVTRAGGALVSLSAVPPLEALRAAGMRLAPPVSWLLPMMLWWTGRAARAAGVRLAGQVTVPSGARLAAAAEIARTRGLQVRVDRVFGWAELDQALAHLGSGAARGRVIVRREG